MITDTEHLYMVSLGMAMNNTPKKTRSLKWHRQESNATELSDRNKKDWTRRYIWKQKWTAIHFQQYTPVDTSRMPYTPSAETDRQDSSCEPILWCFSCVANKSYKAPLSLFQGYYALKGDSLCLALSPSSFLRMVLYKVAIIAFLPHQWPPHTRWQYLGLNK